MPDRIIKIDAEIHAIEQKLEECKSLKLRLTELQKMREQVLAELDKKPNAQNS